MSVNAILDAVALNDFTAADIRKVYKAMQAKLEGKNLRKYKVGDTVRFNAKTRGWKTGEIQKLNVRTAKVNVQGVVWTVPVTMLERGD